MAPATRLSPRMPLLAPHRGKFAFETLPPLRMPADVQVTAKDIPLPRLKSNNLFPLESIGSLRRRRPLTRTGTRSQPAALEGDLFIGGDA